MSKLLSRTAENFKMALQFLCDIYKKLFFSVAKKLTALVY